MSFLNYILRQMLPGRSNTRWDIEEYDKHGEKINSHRIFIDKLYTKRENKTSMEGYY